MPGNPQISANFPTPCLAAAAEVWFRHETEKTPETEVIGTVRQLDPRGVAAASGGVNPRAGFTSRTDRRSIAETGYPVTWDIVYALDNGPVLSHTYDCIKDEDPAAPLWRHFIRTCDFDVQLRQDPGVEHLAPVEVELLRQIAEEHRHRDVWDMIRYVHKLPEWKQNRPRARNRKLIRPRDILVAVGLGDDADDILAEAAYLRRFDERMGEASRTLENQRVAAGY